MVVFEKWFCKIENIGSCTKIDIFALADVNAQPCKYRGYCSFVFHFLTHTQTLSLSL